MEDDITKEDEKDKEDETEFDSEDEFHTKKKFDSQKEFDSENKIDSENEVDSENDYFEDDSYSAWDSGSKKMPFTQYFKKAIIIVGSIAVFLLLVFLFLKIYPSKNNHYSLDSSQTKDLDTRIQLMEGKYETNYKIAQNKMNEIDALKKQLEHLVSRIERLEHTINLRIDHMAKRLDASKIRGYKPTNNRVTTNKPENTPSNKPASRYHIVRKHDTLYGIGKRYNISIMNLKALNNLKRSTLHPGQKLIISE